MVNPVINKSTPRTEKSLGTTITGQPKVTVSISNTSTNASTDRWSPNSNTQQSQRKDFSSVYFAQPDEQVAGSGYADTDIPAPIQEFFQQNENIDPETLDENSEQGREYFRRQREEISPFMERVSTEYQNSNDYSQAINKLGYNSAAGAQLVQAARGQQSGSGKCYLAVKMALKAHWDKTGLINNPSVKQLWDLIKPGGRLAESAFMFNQLPPDLLAKCGFRKLTTDEMRTITHPSQIPDGAIGVYNAKEKNFHPIHGHIFVSDKGRQLFGRGPIAMSPNRMPSAIYIPVSNGNDVNTA